MLHFKNKKSRFGELIVNFGEVGLAGIKIFRQQNDETIRTN